MKLFNISTMYTLQVRMDHLHFFKNDDFELKTTKKKRNDRF